jgi:hypothetical protein
LRLQRFNLLKQTFLAKCRILRIFFKRFTQTPLQKSILQKYNINIYIY